jgi:AbiV family abortive infection protein
MRDFLEGHRLKFMGALLLCLLDGARPGVADRVAGMAGLADALRAAEHQADGANTAKQRGLYADLLADGALSLPSDISEEKAAASRADRVSGFAGRSGCHCSPGSPGRTMPVS